MSEPLHVFVPSGAGLYGIYPGSAIVGSFRPDGVACLDYEGGIFAQEGFERFETRLLHAAGRHLEAYPTTARMWLEPALVHEVGTYDYATQRLEVTDQEALDAWIARWRPRGG